VSVRLQKVLAAAGLGSRRACEEMIREGRVTVDGRTATIGMSVNPQTQQIRLDGTRVKSAESPVYIAVYKPVGVLSTTISQGGKPTILDVVEVPKRVFPVGRLDVDSEGLMLLTNDGGLTQDLTHPRYGKEKEYRVLLDHPPTPDQVKRWREGVRLPDGSRALATSVRSEGNGGWVRVVMRQGRKRQIRETARVLGLGVRRLIRIRIGSLRVGGLKPGEWRLLSTGEVAMLKAGRQPSKTQGPRPTAVAACGGKMEGRG
jgi:23S rRNA pseudouridine2605 synthase